MNIPYLAQVLSTNKLSELVANIDLPALDMNLALWDSIEAGEIEINEPLDTFTVLGKVTPSSDDEMRDKILRVIQHYSKNGSNVTRGRLNSYIKDPASGQGYPWHVYVMAAQNLIDNGEVEEEVITVPAAKKTFTDKKGRKKEKEIRPTHTFVFMGLPGIDNQERNAAAVNKWIADIDAQMVK